jgi:TPR repeat protein
MKMLPNPLMKLNLEPIVKINNFFLIVFLCATFLPNISSAATLQEAKTAIDQKNFSLAREIYETLAEKGDAKAQYNLGLMYASGDGVPYDAGIAASWFKKSAAQGYREAQYTLAVMTFNKELDALDYMQAIKWYQAAAEQGHLKSQENLGILFYRGDTIEQDINSSIYWFQLAANQNSSEAQQFLAYIYSNGAVPEDLTKAGMWMMLSAENPDTRHLNKRKNLLKFLMSKMTAEQITLARELTKKCVAQQFKDCQAL